MVIFEMTTERVEVASKNCLTGFYMHSKFPFCMAEYLPLKLWQDGIYFLMNHISMDYSMTRCSFDLMAKMFAFQSHDCGFKPYSGHDYVSSFDASTG
jgi:hypothetical protein